MSENSEKRRGFCFKRCRGLTLMETMVFIVIVSILAALVVPRLFTRPEEARHTKAKQEILAIQSALELYRLDNGFFPSTEQGLQALVTRPTTEPIPAAWRSGGYLKELPVDPWGRPYLYVNPGKRNPTDVDVFSYGPKGNETTETEASVIGNWK